ncbi:MAG: hypothetical protein OSB09_08200 [Planctomycetota bacterium]|nr:hypothetical protein [Planctomycetota bacterium]
MTTPDRYRRLFGEVAIEKGWVGEAQIYEALTVQERLRSAGKQVPLLGQVLVELGHLAPEQVQELIEILYPVKEDVGSGEDQKVIGSEDS